MSEDHDSKRTTFLTSLLGVMGVVFFGGFLILITGGFFIHVVLVVGVITLFGWLHYMVWGKLLTDHTAGEREEHLLLERMREEELDKKR